MQDMENIAIKKRAKEAEEKRRALALVSEAKKAAENRQLAREGKPTKKRRKYVARKKAEDPLEGKKVHMGGPHEITSSTFLGLWVTARTAISLCIYLCNDVGFAYLLTRKINQDALEVLSLTTLKTIISLH